MAGEGSAVNQGLDGAPDGCAASGWRDDEPDAPAWAAAAGAIQLHHVRQQLQPHPSFLPVSCRRQAAQRGRIAVRYGILNLLCPLVLGQGWRSSNLKGGETMRKNTPALQMMQAGFFSDQTRAIVQRCDL